MNRTYIFITQSPFHERFSVAGYSLQTSLITFWGKNLRIQVLVNFPWIFFADDETLTILSQLILAFAILYYLSVIC